ncbi:hypothetical protein [Epilithonimonas zeae]|uniref:hypothetical protein n=1 Tax=Epilithonimonas zeae TaxID=1416779 RepID=UPI00200EDF62|nr:hypothetical protein [Epilithonimonas zeae]UQB67947.1 hypothetical protein KI430_13025 [Epilithonimonas zeae]
MIIPQEIDSSELLVRFIFIDYFKKKNIHPERFDKGQVFLDDRLFGISLQRENYCNDKFCKERAKLIDKKVYVGFLVFSKEDFNEVCSSFARIRANFDAKIEFTPLDENNEYLAFRNNIDSEQLGNPSHSDIVYYNPAIQGDESNPKTALRAFSQQLFPKCCLILDNDPDNDNFTMDSVANQYYNFISNQE